MIIAFPILHHFPIYSIDISKTHDEIANLEIHILVKDIELASDKIDPLFPHSTCSVSSDLHKWNNIR